MNDVEHTASVATNDNAHRHFEETNEPKRPRAAQIETPPHVGRAAAIEVRAFWNVYTVFCTRLETPVLENRARACKLAWSSLDAF